MLKLVRATLMRGFCFLDNVQCSDVAKQDGAVYRFRNVATNIDATVKIIRRSSPSAVLNNIDVPGIGWSKASAREQLRATVLGAWQGKAVQIELFNANGTRVQSKQLSNADRLKSQINCIDKRILSGKASCNGQNARQRIIKD